VYPSREIAHLWANKTQEDARNQQGNLYFEGDTIYSYGAHFPIARHISNPQNETAVLFTTKGYSNTTSKHKSYVARAIRADALVFNVSDVRICSRQGAKQEFEKYREQIADASLAAQRARKAYAKDWKTRRLEGLIGEANGFAAFFGLSERVTVEGIEELKARAIEARKQVIAENKRRADQKRIEDERRLKLWIAGESDYPPWGLDRDYLRVKGDEVQTSRGVSVPVSHAKRLYEFARQVRVKGEAWVPNGHTLHIGVYEVRRIEADGTIIAGCHRIEWAEAERIGSTL